MKKVFLGLILSTSIVLAKSGMYKGNYPICMSEQYLDDWTSFSVDGDKESMLSYYGSKCIKSTTAVRVSAIDTHIMSGKVSFIYRGTRLWGYYEGTQ